MRTTRSSISTPRGQISFLTGGTGSPVLFLHGVPGSSATWSPVLEQLPERAGTVFVPDLLGFGESAGGEGIDAVGLDAQAQGVAALLDSFDLSSVLIVTHDFGGPVALQLSGGRKDLIGGLVLSATNAFPDTPIPFPLSSIFWPIIGSLAAAAIFSPASLRLMLRTGSGAGAPKLDGGSYVGRPEQARTIRTIFEHSLRHLEEVYAPLERILVGLSVPVAVLWGDRDPFFDATHGRRTADAVGAALTLLPGAGHFLPAERPAAYVAAIDSLRSSSSAI